MFKRFIGPEYAQLSAICFLELSYFNLTEKTNPESGVAMEKMALKTIIC